MEKEKGKENREMLFLLILTTLNSVIAMVVGVLFVIHVENSQTQAFGSIVEKLIVIVVGITFLINIGVIHKQNRNLKKNLKGTAEINEELKRVDRSKDAFISNMSHEIRTPINAMLGLDEMILEESSEKNIIEYAEGISSAGKTLLELINDILDYSKIESGKMEIIPQDYDLGSIVNDLLNMIELRAKSKGLKLEVNINKEIPRYLFGDDLRIKQIILNILTNAIKYTNAGIISLTMDYEKASEEYILLCVSVQDTGIGMKKEELDKLAMPFERLDEKKNRDVEGTGLGMNIVVNLLKQMDTSLKVDSTYGKGSCFSFNVKQRVVEWSPIGAFDGRYKEVKEAKEEKIEFYAPRGRILVIDDNEINLKVFEGLLRETGLKIDTALSGPEGLKLTKESKYNAIFLDHRMPGMDGIATLHNMQGMNTPNNDTPVIALTANVVDGARESYLNEGFVGYVAKPVSKTSLKKILLKYLPDDIIEKDARMEEAHKASLRDKGDEGSIKKALAGVMIKNIDVVSGVEACGSEELYKEVAVEFADSADSYCYEIQSLREQEDYENYTIKVHALKSVARLAGAKELSIEAEYLENCGNYGKIDEIDAKTEALLSHCMEAAGEIKNIFRDNKAEAKEISKSEFKESLVAISCFNDAFDYDKVDEIMDMLSEYKIPDSLADVYSEIKKYVLNLDQENIRATVKKFLGGQKDE